tara:strand:+ start:3414 stop:4340 length:927 start_codon:yes stop_codon:yes gene_type:complete
VNNIYQTTLAKPVIFRGIGLHSGKNSEIKVLPSDANTGVIFKRVDLENNNLIKANYQNVSSAKLCTTLENNSGVKVSTVEHLLAALYIADIDNVIIEINSEEVPIMDGSAKEFLKIFKKSKIKILAEKRNFIKVSKKVELTDGKRNISLEPHDNTLEVEFHLEYENKVIGKQKNIVNLSKDNITDVSESRTFCLFRDIEKIKKAGLAKGGSLDNAIVVDDHKVLNENGLRNEKEFVNHKILDLVGDFMLSGFRISGKVKCYQGGHQLTNMFLRKLLSSHAKETNQKFEKFQISGKLNLEEYPKTAISA